MPEIQAMFQLTPASSLLALLVSGHVLGDFLVQTDRMAESKAEKTGSMVKHALLMLAAHLALLFMFWSAPVILVVSGLAVVHFVIDMGNRTAARKFGRNLSQFIADQALHYVSVGVAWWVLLGYAEGGWFALWGADWVAPLSAAAIVFSGFTMCVRGGTMVVARVLSNHPELVPREGNQPAWGRTTGYLERCLFFVLVLLNQWIALGLVVAAKSWRGGPKIEVDEEYYRTIGFLASMLVAIVTGVLVRLILLF